MLGAQPAEDGSELLSCAAQAALCITPGGSSDLCMPDTLREQRFLQDCGVSGNPISIQSQISLRQNFCGGRWVQGNVCVCVYIFEKKPYGNSQEMSFLRS